MRHSFDKVAHFNLRAAFLLVVMVLLSGWQARAQQKSDLRVLVVAHNPDLPYTDNYSSAAPSERQMELAGKRGQEYLDLLQPHFKEVTLVYTERYQADLSDDYDVTIFDDLPRAIDSVDMGMYRSGKSYTWGGSIRTYPRYIPEDFDRAVIAVGPITDDLTYMIPSKFMTQCHCILEGYGYNTRTEHPIFNTPIPVDLEYEMVETPANFKRHFNGVDLPDQIPVWWAQTESVSDKTGYWVGQILVGMGFEDSPDAEFISGSNNIKDIDGMALGRNGNFFHWGFSASPAFMTEQARQVFINTVHYMAQFNGKTPVVPRYVSGSRLWANEWSYQQTGRILDLKKEFVPSGDSKKDSLYLFYKENYPYLYIHNQGFDYQVDEDARQLGIANNDPALLDKAVELLKSPHQAAMGKRILERYTDFRFATYKEWKDWLDTYRDYLFFTETGGFKYMIDTYNHPHLELPATVGNQPQQKPGKVAAEIENKDDEIIGVNGKLVQHDQGYSVEIAIDIEEGWHLYQDMPEDGIFVITTLDIDTPEGIEKTGPLKHSDPVPYADLEDTYVYKGQVLFVQELQIDPDALGQEPIICTLYYQTCNDYLCHPPSQMTFELQTNDLSL